MRKVKRNICNIFYWTLIVIASCIYFLTNLDFKESVKIPFFIGLAFWIIFDKRFNNCF